MEGKKVLWVVFSIALALVVILAAGLFLLRPRQAKSSEAPAVPSLQGYDPYEYVRGTSAPPGLNPTPAQSEPVVIVVGEPSSAPPVVQQEAAPVAAAEPRLAEAHARAYAPAAAPAAQSAAKPAAPPERAPEERAATPQKRPPQERVITPPERASARPDSRPKSLSVTEYWIQAGSFSSASRADEVSRRLEERGLAARTTTRDLNGKTHFRVRVGPYTSKAEAEKFLGWIRELKGFETSYISMVASRRSMP
jgi:cell division protein FtsN